MIGEEAQIGVGESALSKLNASVYAFDLATIGEKSVIPAKVKIGKNTAIRGRTEPSDYPDGELASGGILLRQVNSDESIRNYFSGWKQQQNAEPVG